jgi:hypothetical protein
MPVTNLTPRIVRRYGARAVVTTGLLVIAVALALRAQATVDTRYGGLLLFAVVFAVGMGLVIAPATASIMASVPKEKAGVGSAINDTTRQVGGALGVAILGSLFSSGYTSSLDGRVGTSLPATVVDPSRDSIGSALSIARGLGGPDGARLGDAARHAFIHGADLTCWVAAGVAVVGALIASTALPRHRRAPVVAVDLEESVLLAEAS